MDDINPQSYKKVPQHIAVIMDGNGRWATSRGLPRIEGHRRGAESLRETIKACLEIGVKYLSVYAFSTENWGRPENEVNFLMSLLASAVDSEVPSLIKNGIKVRFFGHIAMLPEDVRTKIASAEERTKSNTKLNLNVMLSYGGRAEIIDAANALISKGAKIITEEDISNNLYTANIPDPDLLIRTAGEMRVSNFMLWQIAYSELYITDTLWPEFRKKHLHEAVASYNMRNRKFGAL